MPLSYYYVLLMSMKSATFKNSILTISLLLITSVGALAQSGVPSRNDHIFPAADKAKPFINYDSKGFIINGKRVFIVSAGMEYARVPRALWRDRLLRLKRGGYNTVEFYTFWNYHQPTEGQFNFTGDHDLNAFLKLVKQMGMYAIARVGPYYCGEWNMGGFPIWLRFKPGLRVREDNPQFLSAVDKFFDKLIPIVANNQINNGGPVIMVQLENEHRAAWGTVTPNGYFKHLIAKTTALGLEVPYFFSGLHPGNDPAGDAPNLDDAKRPNPWFSTEYWGVWFLNYGPQPQDSAIYDRRTWKIIAHGGNGYNVYMAHGGTNFDYNNDRDMAASYDYGASVGQAGDLRPLYYSFKRANWFAHSFQTILANSTNSDDNKPAVSDTMIKVTARKSPAGTIAFLDNQYSVAVQFKLTPPANNNIKSTASIKLDAGEIMPVVQDYELTPGIKIAWAPTRIYSIIPQGKTITVLLEGRDDAQAQLYFKVSGAPKIINDDANFKLTGDLLGFNAVVSGNQPGSYSFEANGYIIRIITVNNALAKRSWVIDHAGQNYLVIGLAYGGDVVAKGDQLSLTTERPWEDKTNLPAWIFKPDRKTIKLTPQWQNVRHITKLKLGAWQGKEAAWPLHPQINYIEVRETKDPEQMGADGDITADAWYHTYIRVAETGDYNLQFTNVRDRAALFLNEKRIDTGEVFNKTIKLHLKKDAVNAITVFTAHDGRNKLIFRVGAIDTLDAKGLSGPVTLQKADGTGPVMPVNRWTQAGGLNGPHPASGWKPLTLKRPRMPHLYRTTLNLPAIKNSNTIWRVNTTSLSYGSVWVNGHNLGRYPEKIKIGGHYIPECWLKQGANTIVIYDENGVSPAKVSVNAEVEASRDVSVLQFSTKLLQ
jgi:beta-galactosidase